jgi:hypothetical protein
MIKLLLCIVLIILVGALATLIGAEENPPLPPEIQALCDRRDRVAEYDEDAAWVAFFVALDALRAASVKSGDLALVARIDVLMGREVN